MKPPVLTVPAHLDLPEPECLIARNGCRLYHLRADDAEVARVSFVFRAGTAYQYRPFAASATANMLSEGSVHSTGREIAERLDFLGAWYGVSVDRDCVYLNFASPTRQLSHTLKVATEILLEPAFPEREVRTYADNRREQLSIERRKVDVAARERFAQCLFGDTHPYGVVYDEVEYDTLTDRDLDDHYCRLYVASNCFAVCSGHLEPEHIDTVIRILEALPPMPVEPVAFPPARTRHEAFVERAGAVQSSLRLGRLLFPRSHPDFVGMQVLATLLGGYYGSRLMTSLREERGYTYGVTATVVNFEHAGYLAVATDVGRENTADALAVCCAEFDRLRREPVGAEELEMVRRMMTGEMMRVLDGPFGIADVTIENILCGTDNASIDRNLQTIRSITPDELQRLARQYLDPADIVTVVAGDSGSVDKLS